MSKHAIWLAVVLWCVAGAGVSWAQSYLDLENQIQEFTLDNGIRFLVLERHEVPVFSFVTTVAAGSANETMGYTGVAHLLEHMAFKAPRISAPSIAGRSARRWLGKTKPSPP